jgi:hypothetical protein
MRYSPAFAVNVSCKNGGRKTRQNPLMTLLLRAVLPCQWQGRLRRRGRLSIRLQVNQRFKALILMGNK